MFSLILINPDRDWFPAFARIATATLTSKFVHPAIVTTSDKVKFC